MESNNVLGWGAFSREGRVITNKFGEFHAGYKSFDSQQSLFEEAKNYMIEFEEPKNNHRESIGSPISLKMSSPSRALNKQKLLEHPLFGHMSKVKLREKVESKKRFVWKITE